MVRRSRRYRTIIRETGAAEVLWNRRYEPALIDSDPRIRQALISEGIQVETFNAALLFEPEEIKNRSGGPFQVFTPFWRTCLAAAPILCLCRCRRAKN